MRHIELARACAVVAPGFEEFAVLGKLDDAVVGVLDREIAVAIGDEDVAVR